MNVFKNQVFPLVFSDYKKFYFTNNDLFKFKERRCITLFVIFIKLEFLNLIWPITNFFNRSCKQNDTILIRSWPLMIYYS